MLPRVSMSLIYRRNSVAEKTEPYGTTVMVGRKSETAPPQKTLMQRWCRNVATQLQSLGGKLYAESLERSDGAKLYQYNTLASTCSRPSKLRIKVTQLQIILYAILERLLSYIWLFGYWYQCRCNINLPKNTSCMVSGDRPTCQFTIQIINKLTFHALQTSNQPTKSVS